MRRIFTGMLSVAFSACTAVPVVKEALKCEVPADMLAACGDPAPVRQGITFGEMIDVTGRDRDSLRACALKHRSLADAIAACNSRIDQFNAEVREINARNAAR